MSMSCCCENRSSFGKRYTGRCGVWLSCSGVSHVVSTLEVLIMMSVGIIHSLSELYQRTWVNTLVVSRRQWGSILRWDKLGERSQVVWLGTMWLIQASIVLKGKASMCSYKIYSMWWKIKSTQWQHLKSEKVVMLSTYTNLWKLTLLNENWMIGRVAHRSIKIKVFMIVQKVSFHRHLIVHS